MILLLAVLLGLLAGMIRAESGKRHYQTANLKAPWLVIPAFLAQVAVAELHHIGIQVNEQVAGFALLTGQTLLLGFCLVNLKQAAFPLLSIGALSNLLVMLFNHGLMPISPTTIADLYPQISADTWAVGHHLWNSKNIVLTEELTRLPFLADRFIIPDWLTYRVAFSLGDILLAVGVIWFFWSMGGSPDQSKELTNEKMELNASAIRKNWWKSGGKGTEQNTDSSCN